MLYTDFPLPSSLVVVMKCTFCHQTTPHSLHTTPVWLLSGNGDKGQWKRAPPSGQLAQRWRGYQTLLFSRKCKYSMNKQQQQRLMWSLKFPSLSWLTIHNCFLVNHNNWDIVIYNTSLQWLHLGGWHMALWRLRALRCIMVSCYAFVFINKM